MTEYVMVGRDAKCMPKYEWVTLEETQVEPVRSPTESPRDHGYWMDRGNRKQRRSEAAKARRNRVKRGASA